MNKEREKRMTEPPPGMLPDGTLNVVGFDPVSAAIDKFWWDGASTNASIVQRRRMQDTIDAAEAAQWRPFVTAPTDRDFLVELKSGYVTRGRFIGGRYFACDSTGPTSRNSDTTPNRWREIPQPPKE